MTNPATETDHARLPKPPFLRRVRIRNYRSIASCDVELGPLTVLVGRNGSGKSNFLDALNFVGNAFRTSTLYAINARGGFDEISRRAEDQSISFSIELDMDLGDGDRATFGFEIAKGTPHKISILWERLEITGADPASYSCEKGVVVHWDRGKVFMPDRLMPIPPMPPDHFFLISAAGLPEFRRVYDLLNTMEFYDFSPIPMRGVRLPDAGEMLHPDGRNIASVLGRIDSAQPELKERIRGYLQTIVHGVTDVERVALGPMETLSFRQTVSASGLSRVFYATSMSDGTLRAFGSLIAVAQLVGDQATVRLVGIEEPESALHPAAGAALMDALHEAAMDGQIIVTTHSPDLLDQIEFEYDRLLVVQMNDGVTEIGSLDQASRQIIREHLYSAGDLLRMDQLEPDWKDLERQRHSGAAEFAEGPG